MMIVAICVVIRHSYKAQAYFFYSIDVIIVCHLKGLSDRLELVKYYLATKML